MPKDIYDDIFQSVHYKDNPKEHCGLFGIYGNKQAGWLAYLGLYALQHRGQESCGIVSSDKSRLYFHKNMGLVNDVFNPEVIKRLKGEIAIGHVRYSTTGKSILKNAQPILIDYRSGQIAIGHNGNLVNSKILRDNLEKGGSIFQTTTDSEIILHLMAHSKKSEIIDSLIYALERIKGAYSLILMTKDKVIGVRDPLGFRPLCLGKLGKSFCLASETCALDLIDAKFIREVKPGEIIVLDEKGVSSVEPQSLKSKKNAFCFFEFVYFSRPDSFIFGSNVHLTRQALGEKLAVELPVDADLVIPVPDSGFSAALGFSHASGIPLEMGIIRNHYVGRTFIQPAQDMRDLGVRVKFNSLRQVIKGKRIVIVDDSIVRGTTSRIRMKNLRRAGAKEIHLRISCPPHKFPCFYGIDFPNSDELIANKYKKISDIKNYLEVDSLGYLSLEGMLGCVRNPQDFCTACWSGKYPLRCQGVNKFNLEA